MLYINNMEQNEYKIIDQLKLQDVLTTINQPNIIHESKLIYRNNNAYSFFSKINPINKSCHILKIDYNRSDKSTNLLNDNDIVKYLIVTEILQKKYNYNVTLSPDYWKLINYLKHDFNFNFDDETIDYYVDSNSLNLRLFYSLPLDPIYSIMCKINFRFNNLHILNFKNKINHFCKLISDSLCFTDKNLTLLKILFEELSLNTLYNDNKLNLLLLNSEITTVDHIIKNIETDKIELSKTKVNIEYTQKHLQFLEKLGQKDSKLLSKVKTLPFKLSYTSSALHKNFIQIKSFFGTTYTLSNVDRLFTFERLLYICNKYESYESSIRQLILEVM